ncbi:MAG: type II secretion system protein [Gammaproteobacteria bacterium WSBS_2016_MAG_OTU1]
MRQRGFSLIEIAIVIVVIGMLTTLSVTSYFNYYRTQQNKQVERQIENIKSAIVNYAAANKTITRTVEVVNALPVPIVGTVNTITLRWTLPASRPYLPCPDVTGDGEEDRVVPTNAILSITLAVGANYDLGEYPLEATGGCHSDRGVVPWRTLNTVAEDVWGNRYSYRVMPSFSNALVGFDQSFRADSILYRPLTVVGTSVANITIVSQPPYSVSAAIALTNVLAPWTAGELQNYVGPSFICSSSPCPGGGSVTLAGNFYAIRTDVNLPSRAEFDGDYMATYETNAPREGVPFVVLSHGRNGYGGVRGDSTGDGYVCNPFPPHATAGVLADEKQNALWYAPMTMTVIGTSRYQCAPTANVDFIPGAVGVGFVAGIRSGERTDDPQIHVSDGYDDIVSWMSVDELMNNLNERQVLPVHSLPPIGLEK